MDRNYIWKKEFITKQELRVNTNLYLKLKEGETKEDATCRLYNIINEIEEFKKELVIGELFDFELQDI